MKELMDRLTAIVDHKNDPTYTEADIRAHAGTVIELERGSRYPALLAVVEEGIIVSFAVFEFSSSEVGGANATYERVFHGSGPSGSLRELRHTYWGEPSNAGYIYFPRAWIITEAFKALQRWFDCD